MLEHSLHMRNKFTLQVVLAQMEMWIELQTLCTSHNNLCTEVKQHRINAFIQVGKNNIVKKMELNHKSWNSKH
jgi:hypothetical protein